MSIKTVNGFWATSSGSGTNLTGNGTAAGLLNGGRADQYIKYQQNAALVCGTILFDISSYIGPNTSEAIRLTEASLSYEQAIDSHGLFNVKVTGTNIWELLKINQINSNKEITSYLSMANSVTDSFNTSIDGEDSWFARSKFFSDIKDIGFNNTSYLGVRWAILETNDTTHMTVKMQKVALHFKYDEKYYAKFYNNGTLEKTQTVDGDSAATYYTPTRYGYKFLGWRCSADNKLYNSGSLPIGTKYDITYTAEWELGKYTLNFKNADGSNVSSKTVTYNTNIGDLPSISRNGYTFAGWVPCAPAKKTDGNILDSLCYYGDKNSPKALSQSYKYTNNLSLHIEAFMDNWDSISNPSQQIISCTEGGGWGLGYNANTVGHGFEIHTGSYKGVDLGFGTSGKFTNGQWYYFDLVFTNSTLKAYINGVEKGSVATGASISYNSSNTIFVGGEAGGNATSAPGNYFNGLISNVFIANSPNRLAYATTTTKMPGENVNYYPVWRINRYTVSFNANGGNVSSTSKVVVFNYSYGDLPTPTRTGYTFDGWFTAASGGTQITSSSTFTNVGNQTLYAHWTPITYTIQFNSNMENTLGNVNSISLAYDAPPTNLPKNNFRKIDYIVNSWNTKADGSGTKFTDQQSVQNLATTNTTITLYAQWDFVGDINYDNLFSLSSWYTSIAGQKTNQGGDVTADLKTGTLSIFCPNSASSPDNNICAWDYDIPLQAGESYIFEYDTTIPSGGGTQVHIFYINDFNATSWIGFPNTNIYRNASESKVQMPFTLPANAVGVNFRFGTTNEKGITNTLSNMKLYKQSTYNSSISKIDNYKNRDYIPDLISIYSPSKTGYDFNGWTRDEGGADSLTLQGIKNFTQSTTVYSKWTPYNYYIEFNGNGADNTGTMSTQIFTYDQPKNLTQNGFSRYRYKFINWNTKADGTGQSYENNSEILNLTAEKNKTIVLYAQWEYIPLERSIFIKSIPVKKILIDSDEVIEVFTNKVVFFRSPKEE